MLCCKEEEEEEEEEEGKGKREDGGLICGSMVLRFCGFAVSWYARFAWIYVMVYMLWCNGVAWGMGDGGFL